MEQQITQAQQVLGATGSKTGSTTTTTTVPHAKKVKSAKQTSTTELLGADEHRAEGLDPHDVAEAGLHHEHLTRLGSPEALRP